MGPGPFTGLRVGIASAQVVSTVLGIPLHGICSLDVIAAQYVAGFRPADDFIVATDARRREVYWARYAASGARVSRPEVGSADTVPSIPVVGPAADQYPDRLSSVRGPGCSILVCWRLSGCNFQRWARSRSIYAAPMQPNRPAASPFLCAARPGRRGEL